MSSKLQFAVDEYCRGFYTPFSNPFEVFSRFRDFPFHSSTSLLGDMRDMQPSSAYFYIAKFSDQDFSQHIDNPFTR